MFRCLWAEGGRRGAYAYKTVKRTPGTIDCCISAMSFRGLRGVNPNGDTHILHRRLRGRYVYRGLINRTLTKPTRRAMHSFWQARSVGDIEGPAR